MAINYIYYPEIKLGTLTIYTWGLIVAIGFLVGITLAARYGKKKGFREDNIYGLAFYILLGAIIGARIAYILAHLDTYREDLVEIFRVWNGGMSFFGGLVGSTVLGYAYMKIKKLDFGGYTDLLAPYIALGHAIGRLGCVLGDGGHLGKPTNLPWGVIHEGAARHPGALYEMIALPFLFVFLIKLRKRELKTGNLFLLYIIGYSILRIGIDFLRAEPTHYGLTNTQWGLVTASTISIILLIKKREKKKNKGEHKKEIKEETEHREKKQEKESIEENKIKNKDEDKEEDNTSSHH